MNYRHHFHAGSLADIVKHITLTELLVRLCQKPAPFCVVDTHAAAGIYDLTAVESTKTGEAQAGIFQYWKQPAAPSHTAFRKVLETLNPESVLKYYPGSPAIIRHFLRAQDKGIAIEKHPEEAEKLRRYFGRDDKITVHIRDAWDAMKALIPTPEKRLLVFIDPPYEQPGEVDDAISAIKTAHTRMTHALFALWYPLKDPVETGILHEKLAQSGMKKILRADVPFCKKPLQDKMHGSGMVIINPPYQLENALRECYAALQPLFEKSTKPATLEWLAGE